MFQTNRPPAAIIKRLVGKDVMRVQEAQARAALPGGAIRLTSLPVPDMPGGAKFATRAVFTFSNNAGGCRVRGGERGSRAKGTSNRPAAGASHNPGGRACWPTCLPACPALCCRCTAR